MYLFRADVCCALLSANDFVQKYFRPNAEKEVTGEQRALWTSTVDAIVTSCCHQQHPLDDVHKQGVVKVSVLLQFAFVAS